MTEQIRLEAKTAALQLCEAAKLSRGAVVIVGCSSSEILGQRMGTQSTPEIGKAVFEGLYEVFREKGIFLAAQCCEHLNRAVIIEREAVPGVEIVSVLPQPKAGGSFATAAYSGFSDPVAVEEIKADAGLDIGGTLIGMHLKKVAVPLKLDIKHIGEAIIIAARTRPKLIGGSRAVYDEKLL
jgi:uncharacterized protein (TIGR01440 family)